MVLGRVVLGFLAVLLQADAFFCTYFEGQEYTLLRVDPTKTKLLLVNNHTLQTHVRINTQNIVWDQCQKDSHYVQRKKEALAHPFQVANRGVVKGDAKGFALTVDMCPSSKKGFEEKFFRSLIDKKKGYPVTISMTKKWAKFHPKEFALLKKWDDEKMLDITWMNHGSQHPYERTIPLDKNFINLPGIDFRKEVLDNENFLMKEGRTPSIFYRFAGLVSNKKAYDYLIKNLGLIPVGSLAWLAKGESIKGGSIVLLHGNKNEPLGIERFLEQEIDLPVVNLAEIFQKPTHSDSKRIYMHTTFLVLHIISFISWFAMLFYLPRLFVYHAERHDNQGFIEVVRIMEHKLYKYIGVPAMWATLITGGLLIWANMQVDVNLFKTGGWLHAKLLFVLFLVVYTFYLGKTVRDLAEAAPAKSGKFYRILNEVPTLLMIFIVVMVIAKPF